MLDGSIVVFTPLLAQAGTAASPAPAASAPPTTTEVVGLPQQPPSQTAASTPGVTGAPGTIPAPAARPPGGGDFTFLILMFGLLLFLIIMSVVSSRKEKKRREQLLSSVSTNDRVQTVGGILGTVVELRDDEVVLRVDENTNTRIRFSKAAVQQIVRKADGSKPGQTAEPKPDKAKIAV